MKYIVLALLLAGCSGTWQLQENNDYFKPSGNRDRSYSQGIKLSKITPDDTGSTVVSVGQNIYTPADKQTTTYIESDRPYAGFLYSEYAARYVESPNVCNTYSVTAGIVGPSSLAEQAQNETHRLINVPTAKGWDNQLRDELGLILTAEQEHYYPVVDWLATRAIIGANLGNVFTQGYSLVGVKIGYNLDHGFKILNPVFPRAPTKQYSYYIFAELLERIVVRNIFLDGNTFKDSYDVDKETFVSETRLGVAVEYVGYVVRYTYIEQSEEFEGDRNGTAFGEVAIVWNW